MAKTILDELISAKELLLQGHSACQGCGSTLALRYVLKALGENTILVIPASCSSVYQGLYPKVAFKVHTFNTAFASAAAVASGMINALEKKGSPDTNVVVWGGDGGLTDIGFATVSGAAERNENILVIEYDNEAYMNTGIQRSGSTPTGAKTTTTYTGKFEPKKSISLIALMHGVPYVATANPSYPIDLYNKVKTAMKIRGFKLIHIFSPCPPGWRYDDSKTVEIGKLAVETGYWILWEAFNEDGKIKLKLSPPSRPYLNPEKRKPLEEFLKLQGRFKKVPAELIESLKKWVNAQWEIIKKFMV